MASDGNVRINFNADVSDVRRGTRDTIRELDRVNQAAERSSQSAARGSAKAVSGILRMVETGKVTTKGLDKIGKSVGGVVSSVEGLAGGIGVALGLGALPALSDLAAAGIGRIRAGLKGLSTELGEAAAAQRDYTIAAMAASGSADGVTLANQRLTDATKALDEARRSGKATGEQITSLEIAQRQAAMDATVAQNNHADAIKKSKDAQAEYARQAAQVIEKSKQLAPQIAAANGGFLNQHVYALAASKALRDHANSAKDLTQDQRAAERSIADYIDTTGKVPKDIKTLIATPGMNPALDRFNALQAQANALDGRTIKITTIQDTVTETHRLGIKARGGPINTPMVMVGEEAPQHPEWVIATNPAYREDNLRYWAKAGQDLGVAGFARGGKKSKVSLADRNQSVLDVARGRFDATMSLDDLHLARAEQTKTFSDDAAVFRSEQSHIGRRIKQIQKLRRRRGLTLQQRQDLNDEEAQLVRQLADINGQLHPAAVDTGGGGSTVDPFAEQRARDAGFAAGLGRAIGYVFGGSGDIGSGGGNALTAAGGIGTLHVANVVIKNTPANQTQLASAGNTGNALVNRGRVYTPRVGSAFGR